MKKSKKTARKRALQAPPVTPALSAFRLRVAVGMAIIVLAVLIAYLPAINGGFVLDDNGLLTENQFINSSDGLYRFWCTTGAMDYWPATNTTLWIEWRLWGMSPAGYHVTNLVLHVAEALLVWLVLSKLSIPGAFLAALIFAVHPVNVETAAWISQRKNLMAMLFFLLSILWYLKYIEHPSADHLFRGSPAFSSLIPHPSSLIPHLFSSLIFHPSSFYFVYWLSLAAFVLAMLSKGSVVVFPVLLVGIIWWLRPLTRWDLVRTLPFFAVAAVLAIVNMWFQTHGTEITYRTAGFAERLLGAAGVVWFYLYKALLPIDMAFIYPQWNIEARKFVWWLPLGGLGRYSSAVALQKKLEPAYVVCLGIFLRGLVPVMGFIDVGFMQYSLVADHYQHIAIIGLIALAAAGWGA